MKKFVKFITVNHLPNDEKLYDMVDFKAMLKEFMKTAIFGILPRRISFLYILLLVKTQIWFFQDLLVICSHFGPISLFCRFAQESRVYVKLLGLLF